MAWIKGIMEALKGVAKSKAAATAATTKVVKPVVKTPQITTTAKVAKTTKAASEQVKTVKSLKVASGEVTGEIPKAIRSSKGLSKGALAIAGFGAGAITAGALIGGVERREGVEKIAKNIEKEEISFEKTVSPLGEEVLTTSTSPISSLGTLETFASNALTPLETIPVLGEAVKEAKERGLAFPFLLLLIGLGVFVSYKVYKAVKGGKVVVGEHVKGGSRTIKSQ